MSIDAELFTLCDHYTGGKQYAPEKCPKCGGKGYYYDISYDLSIRTTTNLPITIKLYRNELYDSSGATNLFSGSTSLQDSDGAWYRLYKCPDSYEMYYKNKTTDVYTIVVNFPQEYAKDLTYENDIENIEVNIKSRQM